ncbi:hypothetical protein J6590_050250 [Homalodisca vitripennis]|nr:hypothetical protein J6590_050250 [Homalodisca vitripennis]
MGTMGFTTMYKTAEVTHSLENTRVVDFRSDTISVPTEGMRRAIYQAEVGDDVMGEDPSVNVASIYILAVYACRRQLERGIERHNRNTRQAMNFTLPVHHLSLFEEKPSYMGVKFLYLLPETIKGPNVSSTRQRLSA